MKIKPTLVGFSGELGLTLSLVLIKTRIAHIPTIKIRQIEYLMVFFELSSLENKMLLESKGQTVNKAQRQLRPEPYFLPGYNHVMIKYQDTITC